MFDAAKRSLFPKTDASVRLKALAAAARRAEPTPAADATEWIDETRPPPVAPRPLMRRWPVLACAMAVAVVCAVVGLSVARPDREVPPPLPAASVMTSEHATTKIVVSVVGKVPHPGLITLTEGARVADAVLAAGGASEVDSLALNMARRLADGEQLHVGVAPPPEAAPPQAKPARVNLNTATESQLDELPGVGEVTAQRIIEWRAQRGRFASVEQLRQVDGIGESKFTRLKDLVTVH
ncbi:MAG: ComEA family DNA-binding protein [Kibdelosporangium sp.]